MQILSQRDNRWKNIKLGFSDTTIGDYGCTVTALAMILGTTPDVINDRLKTVNGFAQGNLVIWGKLEEAFPGIKIKRVWTYDNEDVKANVPNVLVEVDGKPIGGYRHWVVFIGAKKLYDPWTGTERPTSDFPNPLSYCVIGGKWNKPSPQPDNQQIIDELRLQRDNEHNLLLAQIEIVKQKQARIENLEGQVNAKNEEIQKSNRAIITLNERITAMAKAIEADSVEDRDVAGELITVSGERNAYKKDLDFIGELMGIVPYNFEAVLIKIELLKTPNDQVVKEYAKLGKTLEDFFYTRVPSKFKSFWKYWQDKLLKVWFR